MDSRNFEHEEKVDKKDLASQSKIQKIKRNEKLLAESIQNSKDEEQSFFAKQSAIESDIIVDIVEDRDGEFVVIDEGRFSKVYLFVIRRRYRSEIIDYVAWKVQKENYSRIQLPDNISNLDIDLLWKQEFENIKSLEDSSNIINLKNRIKLTKFGKEFRLKKRVPFLSPLWFCREKRKFYSLHCPVCGDPLETCRSDSNIQNFSTLYENSKEQRVLFCRSCVDKTPKNIQLYCYDESQKNLYTKKYGEGQGNIEFTFVSKEEYIQSLFDNRAKSKNFPCSNCTMASTGKCEHFRMFSFYDFHALPLEVCEIPLQYFVEFLSGKPPQQIREGMKEAGWFFFRRFPLHQNLFVFSKKNPAYRATETLYLKLKFFKDICKGLQDIHQLLDKAHLHVVPENIMVTLYNHNSPVEPGSYEVKLLDVAGVSLIRSQADENIPAIYRKKDIDKSLVPQEFLEDYTWQGNLAKKEDEFILNMGEVPAIRFREGDWLRIELTKQNEVVWAQVVSFDDETCELKISFHNEKTKIKSKIQDKSVFSITTRNKLPEKVKLDADSLPIIEIQDISPQVVNFKNYPKCGAQFDLYGLGLVYVQILFGHYYSKPRLLKRIKFILESLPPSVREPQDKIMRMLSKIPLNKQDIMWQQEEAKETESTIPEPIWIKTALLGFKLITSRFKNFSFCCSSLPENDIVEKEIIPEVEEIINDIEDVIFSKGGFYDQSPNDMMIQKLTAQLAEEHRKVKEYENILNSLPGKIAQKISKTFGKDEESDEER